MFIDGDGVFVKVYGSRKAEYCSCFFYIWAADVATAEAAKERLLAKAGSTRITEPMFTIDLGVPGDEVRDVASVP